MFSHKITELATKVLELARRKKLKITTAESCTGGLVIAALTQIPGSSDVVECGFITYSNDAKTKLIGVDKDILKINGAVSAQVAIAMAIGALDNSTANISVSVTGIAGPGGGSKIKPVGLVHMSAKKRGGGAISKKYQYGDIGRDKIREASIIDALNLLKDII